MADIRLEPDDIVVAEGHRLRIEGEDLELRSQQRLDALRLTDPGPRRALVHGAQDELVLNFERDYRQTVVHGNLTVQRTSGEGGELLARSARVERLEADNAMLQGLRAETMILAELRDIPGASARLVRTLEWFHQRLEALEQRAGITAPSLDTQG